MVLSVDPAASPSAQVSWLNFESGHVAVDLTVTPPSAAPPADAGSPAPGTAAPVLPASIPPYVDRPVAAAEFPVSRGGISSDPFAYPSGQPTFAATTSPASSETTAQPPPAEVTLSAAPARPGPVVQARPAVDFWERVPAPTALLVPVVAGLAVLIGVVLGPVGRPTPVFHREGGLSRALARRNPGGTDAV